MAINILNFVERRVDVGQAGYREVSGLAQFNATDATGTIPCRIPHVEEASFTPVGPPATDETIYLNDVSQVVGGRVARESGNTITISRTGASPTSGLMFFFRYRGY